MKKLVIGILAHVDAGKTTLAEGLLYTSGIIRKLGRVDHKDAFLDTYSLERARGITIFSKQAELKYKDLEISLLDTPGHVDFSAEMERTLQVLDYAILVISGSDGIQGHTETLWRLLQRYRIPTFIFVNKMDIAGTIKEKLIENLQRLLNTSCIDFTQDMNHETFMESLAMSDEHILESYLGGEAVTVTDIRGLIRDRKIFPCYFGSALRLEGIKEFLEGIHSFTSIPIYGDQFGAKVYKISRDDQGNRLTHFKITGGSLKVKTPLERRSDDISKAWIEKINQIRIYSGTKYEAVDEVYGGTICAVTGLSKTIPGEGFGIESKTQMPLLQPVLNYQILLPDGCDSHVMLGKLRQLEEEDPQLHIVWHEQLGEIHVHLMGEVQIDIIKNMIQERFGVDVSFGPGNIMYKETIAAPIEGVGHFEPLRHYAEVHLLMEPGMEGSGITVYNTCSDDTLDRNWQQAVLTQIEEKDHKGVLTGSPITDIKITLIAGRAHLKHTEGGDFREATYRAIRHGLKRAKSILLEPYYEFRLEIPADCVGRAMTDIQRMHGNFEAPTMDGDIAILIGNGPVSTMQAYQTEVLAYTRGRGKLFSSFKGYLPCHNAEEVVAAYGYDSERDLANPTGSVFCSHGAGFSVSWDMVEQYMHIPYQWKVMEEKKPTEVMELIQPRRQSQLGYDDKELEEIFVRTFGPVKTRLSQSNGALGYEKQNNVKEKKLKKEVERAIVDTKASTKYLLVDGYNIIFSWDELNSLAKDNIDAARYKLMDTLCNYQGFTKDHVIVVFDAYKVKGGLGDISMYHNIHVVYTKEAETADQYIEKVTHEIAKDNYVTVATSDALEQMIILGKGAYRMSAKELKEEVSRIFTQIQTEYLDRIPKGKAFLGERFDQAIWDLMEDEKNRKPHK